jgi:prepilin-type N-terminal cleavage/methylation domain-containing protein
MKLVPQLNSRNPDARRNLSRAGMTLVELMVAMGLFGFVSVGLLYTHVFCLRQDELVNSKLGASDQSRKGFSLLTRDIRAAKVWEVGNVNSAGTNFTGISEGAVQKGNALRLSYSTNWNEGLLYYFNTNNLVDGGKLYRIKLTTGDTTLIADYLTNRTANALMFQAENYKGAPQTNRTHKGVVKVMLEFAQYQYPLTKVGPGYLYDYYKMDFKLTSHVPDGP